jgi:hypothetical protein
VKTFIQNFVVGQDRLAARPIPMITDRLRLRASGRTAEMVRELAAQGAFDDGILEAADRGLELPVRDWVLAAPSAIAPHPQRQSAPPQR